MKPQTFTGKAPEVFNGQEMIVGIQHRDSRTSISVTRIPIHARIRGSWKSWINMHMGPINKGLKEVQYGCVELCLEISKLMAFFSPEQKADVFKFTAQCVYLMNATMLKFISSYGHVQMMYTTVEGDTTYKETDTLWADMGNAHYNWMCEHRGYLKETDLGPEKKGDVLEYASACAFLAVVMEWIWRSCLKWMPPICQLGTPNGQCWVETYICLQWLG